MTAKVLSSAAPPPSRGAASNPPNRFEALALQTDPDWYDADERPPATRFYRDASQSALTTNDSPDVGFGVSLNPYRGCEHGCIYCYARHRPGRPTPARLVPNQLSSRGNDGRLSGIIRRGVSASFNGAARALANLILDLAATPGG